MVHSIRAGASAGATKQVDHEQVIRVGASAGAIIQADHEQVKQADHEQV